MIQNFLVKLLLSPVAFLYGVGIAFRNLLYQIRFFKSVSFSFPIISIGNLTVGGTGKTPHIEYLTKELYRYLEVGVLSRGYSRKTKGFRLVRVQDNAQSVGDEPLQIKRKFPMTTVAVSESRALGIPEMLKYRPHLKVVLLDDAFQHRSINPGLNVLLTEYNRLFTEDYLLPVGRLREFRSAYKRADIIIVTKTPNKMEESEQEKIYQKLNPLRTQKIYFSYFKYLHPYSIWNPQHSLVLTKRIKVLMISAIASTKYLLEYLNEKVGEVHSLEFEDHHFFSNSEVAYLKKQYDQIPGDNKIILTTEKDATRLALHKAYLQSEKLPIFVLPINIAFHQTSEKTFIETVKTFLLEFKI